MHLINLINVQNLSLYPKKERKKVNFSVDFPCREVPI